LSDKLFSAEKNLGRNGRQGRGGEVEVPVLDPLSGHEVLVSVLVGNDCGAFRVQPIVAVRVVEVPVGIDQVCDRIAAELIGGLQYSSARGCYAGVDEHFAVAAGEDGNVAARAFEDADATAQLVDFDWCLRGGVADQIDLVAGLRECLPGRKPPARSCEGRRPGAAEAEVAPREFAVVCLGHWFSPC
jgi:hypothetical protein